MLMQSVVYHTVGSNPTLRDVLLRNCLLVSPIFWNSPSSFFLNSVRSKIGILDLFLIFFFFNKAFKFVKKVKRERGVILFINNNCKLVNRYSSKTFHKGFLVISDYKPGYLSNYRYSTNWSSLPSVVVVFGVESSFNELSVLKIPSVGLTSGCSANFLTYPIPVNFQSFEVSRHFSLLFFKGLQNLQG